MEPIDHICIVDDDALVQFVTRKIIEDTRLVSRVKVFSNGQEAIDFLQATHHRPEELPSIIMLDLMMPVMDGWEFLEEYLVLQPLLAKKITIYVVSSSIDPNDIERARSISAVSNYLIKPITRENFTDLLRNLQQ